MPDVVGLTEGAARDAIVDMASNVAIETQPREDSGPEGVVLEQEPSAGEAIPDDGDVVLVISVRSVAMPDVVGELVSQARKTLEAAGFSVKDTAVPHSA